MKPPIITKSAPAPNALATSPEFVHPPSLMTCPFRPCDASAHSNTALNCGYPTPAFLLVVQTDPGPMPT